MGKGPWLYYEGASNLVYRRFSYIRLYLTVSVLLVVFILVFARHAYLAVENQAFLLEKSQARTERSMVFPADKGQMIDRNGYPLAVSTPYYRLALNPQKYQYTEKDKRNIAKYLGVSYERVSSKIDQGQDKSYIKLANRLTKNQVELLSKLNHEGLIFEEQRGRYYPLGHAASTVVGYVDADGKGQMGMEYQFDQYIDGHDGYMDYTQNLLNQVTTIHHYEQSISGQELRLTLDSRIQSQAYEILANAVDYHEAEYASAVILSVDTGEILAMANYPSFDPNQPIRAVDSLTSNHAIADLFEPGSIIKPIALAGIMPYIDAPETIDTEGGAYLYLDRIFRDHKDLGVVDFGDILLKSSNIAMVKLTALLQPGQLVKNYQSFGLFSPLFVQLPGEALGRHVVNPGLIDEAAMSYGYGLSVNLLSMARAYNIIANQGKDPGVHLVFERHRPEPEQVVSSDVTSQITEMMERVTTEGISSHRAGVRGMTVAGKSGTTHLLGQMGEYENQYVSTFSGFAPSQSPKVVVVVNVYKPTKHGHYGGQVAAPVFSKLVSETFNYLS